MTNINSGFATPAVRALVIKGWHYVTICPRGECKGDIISKHRTRDAAERAARGLDRQIVHLGSLTDCRLVAR